jgi:serine O-acetyltransferase
MRNIKIFFSTIRLLPHLLVFNFFNAKYLLKADFDRWRQLKKINGNIQIGFIEMMTFFPEYRNLFYHRIYPYNKMISWLCPKMSSMIIGTRDIGPGLVFHHGWSTYIEAKSIGKDCWIFQHVTIAYANETDHPTIGDNVTIYCNSLLIGNIKIGNNVVIGAGSVVVKDVPDNCVVVGVPARIVKRNGVRVEEVL